MQLVIAEEASEDIFADKEAGEEGEEGQLEIDGTVRVGRGKAFVAQVSVAVAEVLSLPLVVGVVLAFDDDVLGGRLGRALPDKHCRLPLNHF